MVNPIIKFVFSNWGFFAFVLTLCFALWAYVRYGVGYFESQKNISLTKRSSDFYRQLGDKLMLYGEFVAAKDAYGTALKVNPSNIDATRGALKIQAREPLEGQQLIIPEVADLRIRSLKELLKFDEKRGLAGFFGFLKARVDSEDFFIDFLEGELSQLQDENAKAKAFYRMSLEKNPGFIYGYIALATLDYASQDYDAAIATLETAERQDPNSALVLNTLGACHMIKANFTQARQLFAKSWKISPYLSTILNLAEADRYLGNAESALYIDYASLQLVSNDQNEKERIVADDIIFGFMPEKSGEKAPARNTTISSMDQKKMAVYYALSLDHALKGESDKADEAFVHAGQLDPQRGFDSLLNNRILSIENFSGLELSADTRKWMKEKRERLSATPSR